jgi:hypothetical protein
MPNTGGYDVVVQFRSDVISDILTRLLGDATTQDATSSIYVPRQIVYPPAPLQPQAMLWWDAPKVTVTDGEHASLSVAVNGGVRQAANAMDTGRIGTVSGTLTGQMRPVLAEAAGVPHLSLTLHTPDPRGLRVKYGESNALPLVGIGGTARPLGDAIVESLARDMLASTMVDTLLRGLLAALGRLPLVYGLGLTAVETARGGATLRVFGPEDSSIVAIATLLPGMKGDAARIENALAARKDSNVAVTVTSVAATAAAMRMLAAGQIMRTVRTPDGTSEVRLSSLGVQARDDQLSLAAHLSSGPVSGTASAAVTLAPDRNAGRLQIAVASASLELDTLRAGSSVGADTAAQRGQATLQAVAGSLGVAFWGETLAALLGGRYADGELELAPVLGVPGSSVRVVAKLAAVELREGQLTLYCQAPTDAKYSPQKPDKQPQAAIQPQEIPVQAAAGAQVRASVAAQIVKESYPPYDYAWKGGGSPHLLPVRGPRLEVTGTPTGRGDDPEAIGKAHVTLIDSFGQVTVADGVALAHPAQRRSGNQRKGRGRRLALAGVAAAGIAALTLGGIAIAGPGIGGLFGGGSQPGFAVSPLTAIQVTCPSAAGPAAVTPILLDNSAGRTNMLWQASITDQAPGGAEPWAAFTGGGETASGTVPAGQSQQLQVQPARDLCRRVFDTGAQQTFHVSVTYGTAGQATVSVVVGVSRVAVSVQTASTQSKTSDTTLTQDCGSTTNPVQPFTILLDGSQGTAESPFQILISDPPPDQGGTVTPTPGGPPTWATADISSGSIPPAGQTQVTITPVANLCQGVPPNTTVDLHVVVRLPAGDVTIADSVQGPVLIP